MLTKRVTQMGRIFLLQKFRARNLSASFIIYQGGEIVQQSQSLGTQANYLLWGHKILVDCPPICILSVSQWVVFATLNDAIEDCLFLCFCFITHGLKSSLGWAGTHYVA